MTRKSKRPGTRGPRGGRLPTDLADAAEAALDDMLSGVREGDDDEPRTQTRAPSHTEIGEDDVEEEEVLTVARRTDVPATNRRSKLPLSAPPRTTSVHRLPSPPDPVPAPRGSPSLAPPTPRTVTPPGAQPASRPLTPPGAQPATRPSPAPAPRHTPTPPLSRSSSTPPLSRTSAASRPTPTPVLPRPHSPSPLSEVLDSLRPPTMTETPPARSWTAPTYGDSPRSRAELGETAPRFEPPLLDETMPVPSEMIEIESGPVQVDVEEAVPARSELASLQVAVYEESAYFGSVQSAIAAAGHAVHIAGTGRDGVQRVLAAVTDPDSEIDVVIASLPGGDAIIEAALALEPHRPVVIASLGRSPVDAVNRAHAAGADLVTVRPHDVERLAPLLFAAARLHVEKRVAIASRGGASLDDGGEPEPRSLLAFEVFQRVLDLEIARAKRYEYALAVALFAVDVAPPAPPPGLRGILRARAGNALIHSVRDIDIATQLEDERFLVLLPYTDLEAASALARRVIAAVATVDPVVASGGSYAPRVIGAVAGALPGQPLSYAKLLKDATRALEQARRDGAELAVRP